MTDKPDQEAIFHPHLTYEELACLLALAMTMKERLIRDGCSDEVLSSTIRALLIASDTALDAIDEDGPTPFAGTGGK